jgi:hypothetical protein
MMATPVIHLYSPANLSLKELLRLNGKEFWLKHIWKLYYIIYLVYRGRWNKKLDSRYEYVPIKSEYLRNVVGRNHALPGINILIQLKVVESDRKYIVGDKCRGYRFTPIYANESFKAVGLEKNEAIPASAYLKCRTVRINGFEQEFLFKNLQMVTLDKEIHNELFKIKYENVISEDYYFRSVEFICNKDWFFCSDSKTGRVFNNVTSLPRALRPFIRLDGRRTVEIDVANCQPLLLLSLYNGEPERKAFEDAVKDGYFYEMLNSELKEPYPIESRSDLKLAVFEEYLFCKEKKYPWQIARAFKKHFPVLYERVNLFKRPSHKELAILLQKTEADLIIGNVVGTIAKTSQIPILTVHDSVITLPEYADEVKQIIERAFFQRFGFVPTLKIKGSIESTSDPVPIPLAPVEEISLAA